MCFVINNENKALPHSFMKTIFILDTDSEQQKLMSQHLTTLGFQARSVFSVSEFDALDEKPFMIILDEKMENKDRSTMQFLKKVSRKMSRVPIVYMMQRPERKSMNDAKKMGAHEVIEKNSAAFVNLRTTLDRLVANEGSNWFTKLFAKKQIQSLPALAV
jgi:DNA-binding NtrC family response regulator